MTERNHGHQFFHFLFFCLVLTGVDSVSKAQPHKTHFRFRTVVIDAGHGGKDPGTHGRHSLEKNVALAIAKKVAYRIRKAMPGINVIMTRSTDRFVELDRRAQIANEHHANLFISIHCNSTPEGTAYRRHKEKGVMILVYGFHRSQEQREAIMENSVIYKEKDYKKRYGGYNPKDPTSLIILNTLMAKYRKQSVLFGEILNHQFTAVDKRASHGVKEQGVLVLAHSAMPAVLVETGFINNPYEERYLDSVHGQDAIANSIVRAIKIYKARISPN